MGTRFPLSKPSMGVEAGEILVAALVTTRRTQQHLKDQGGVDIDFGDDVKAEYPKFFLLCLICAFPGPLAVSVMRAQAMKVIRPRKPRY